MTVEEIREQIRRVCLSLARSISKGAEANGESLINFSYLIDENIFDRIPMDFTQESNCPGETVRTESAFYEWGPGNHTQMVVKVRAMSAEPHYHEYGLGFALSEELSNQIAVLPAISIYRKEIKAEFIGETTEVHPGMKYPSCDHQVMPGSATCPVCRSTTDRKAS